MRSWLVAAAVAAIGFVVPGPPSTASAAPGAVAATKLRVFQPFTTNGRLAAGYRVVSRRGYCWTGSETGRVDAWRCMIGDLIADPCFESPTSGSAIVCITDPWTQKAMLLRLTKPLPFEARNKHIADPTKRVPWMIVLGNGDRCAYLQGATSGVAWLRLNYGCDGRSKLMLFGQPRRLPGTWTILAATKLRAQALRPMAIAVAWW